MSTDARGVRRWAAWSSSERGCWSRHTEHRSLAQSILSKVSLEDGDLECGPHLTFDDVTAEALLRAGGSPSSIHNNCSGKHAGTSALAVAQGWPTRGYIRRDHPVQVRMIAEIGRWTNLQESEIVTNTLGEDMGLVRTDFQLEEPGKGYTA